jgi:GNAT superfamily N-acetyltransferase
MRLQVPPGAFQAWKESLTPVLGRFAQVTIAKLEVVPIGFLAGRIRALPPYFGKGQVGTITEVFVTDELRNRRIGRQMLEFATSWYRANGVQRLELQVLAGNPDAVRFYEGLGWKQELLQLVLDGEWPPHALSRGRS